MTINSGTAVAAAALPRADPPHGVTAPPQDETSGTDLVLPLVAVGAAGVLAGYGYLRRTRRARTRTTPAGGPAPPPPGHPPEAALDERARDALVGTDDCLRTSREELACAEAQFGAEPVAPYERAVLRAETELAAAFALRLRYDHGLPSDPAARRQALAGMAGRCEEADRLLDAAADGFDRLRALDRDPGAALRLAEVRFRELAARTPATETRLTALTDRYAPSATEHATGDVEQAKDRLVFATARLNQARQAIDSGGAPAAVAHLRAAEGAVAQAAVFLDGVDRLAAELDEAAALVPAALTGAEAERAGAADRLPGVPAGEAHSRLLHADAVLASIRGELTAGRPYDPLDLLRRVVRAAAPLAMGRTGVLSAAALLTARSATAAAAGFVTTHRGAVGAAARTLLAEAERLLAAPAPADHLHADALAREARELAEHDVRARGNPYADLDARASGTAGAVLGGILLPVALPTGVPLAFGGPATRERRAVPTA
ncbi:hypothetical protein HG826_18965 [Streptomyces sp. GMY01]|uniref:hypothetical protein n=1 Tax=Streptomyces sp. GMY02 TaxID=1333528 RepID=UPI00146B9060|nr:hypothetical protein [Streptomyces sp. GMY02]NMO35619.1 hypothetical protein [Streptomyces sp. GMY02]